MRLNKGETERVLSVRKHGNVYTKRPNTRSQEDALRRLYAQSRFFKRERERGIEFGFFEGDLLKAGCIIREENK